MIEVTQDDREAAALVYRALSHSQDARWIDAGLGRLDGLDVVQAFARHRIAAEEAAFLAGALAMRAAAGRAVYAAFHPVKLESKWTRRDGTRQHYAFTSRQVVSAIDPASLKEASQ